MKKFVSMLLVSTMLLTALTACDTNKNNDSDSNPSSSSTTSGGGDSTSTDSETSSGDSSSDNESSTSEDSESTPEDSSSDPESDPNSDEPGEDEGVDNSGLPFPDNKAGNMAKAALATGTWPALDIPEDPEFISALFSPDFKTDDFEEYCMATNVISAQLNKVIIIKPKAGSEDAVSAVVDAYFEAVKTDPNIAFYPGQQASADGAVKGKTDDGYLYVIVHENGADIETAMLAAV